MHVDGTERVRNDNEKGYSPFSTSNNWITRYDCGAWRARRVKEETLRRRRKKKGNVNEKRKKSERKRNSRSKEYAKVKYEGGIDIASWKVEREEDGK